MFNRFHQSEGRERITRKLANQFQIVFLIERLSFFGINTHQPKDVIGNIIVFIPQKDVISVAEPKRRDFF